MRNRTFDETMVPSNDRDWRPDLAVLPTAKIRGNEIAIKNIRNFTHITKDDYVARYYDKTFNLDELKTADFIMVPFKDAPSLAHTMLSFGFENDEHVAVSVEARLERDEQYSPLLGAMRQYELMYVVGDERDLLKLRTEIRDADVFLYRAKAKPKQVRRMFVDMMTRANKLAKEPEFYDTLTNNCTTNLVAHVNQVRPGRIPLADLRLLLPGFSDRLAYDLDLIETNKSFEQTRAEALINNRAERFAQHQDFSYLIRR